MSNSLPTMNSFQKAVVGAGLALTTTLSVAQADIPEEPNIETITTDHPAIQAACPQLSTVGLVEEDLGPLIFFDLKEENTLDLYGEVTHISDDFNGNAEDISRFNMRLNAGSVVNNFAVIIDSPGGSVDTGNNLINAMATSSSWVTTYGKDYIASISADILVGGDTRFITTQSDILVHTASADYSEDPQKNEVKPGYESMFAEDYPVDSEEYESLNGEYEATIEFYEARSTTGVDETCLREIFKDRVDVTVHPDHMLQLGLVDHMIDWENNFIYSVNFETVHIPEEVVPQINTPKPETYPKIVF